MVQTARPHLSTPTDAELMAEVAKGDRGAFGDLVERHHERVLNVAFRLSGDPEIARDVAQETFLGLLRAAHRYEPRAPFHSFLSSIVRNLVLETSRKQRRRREEPLETAGEGSSAPMARLAADESADPLESLHRLEVGERLKNALSALPVKLREVFVLSEMEGFSYQEIARICHCPIGTVASRKHDAVLRLRSILAPLRDGER
jgi:RNA polymerase sigma-70 factor (ECF subfamily)